MVKSQNIYNSIGNESFENLWRAVENNNNFEKTPEYEKITKKLYELMEKVPDKDLMLEIEEETSRYTNLAMYQGFVIGFREAVQLLTI